MSIQSQITRISGNVSDAFAAITNKGVTVPAGSTSDDLADLISQILGGGGLEYETGTWTPAEDVADATILFTSSHSVPPIFVMIADNSSQSIGVGNSNALLVMGNLYTYLGHPVLNSNTRRYGLSVYSYTNDSGMTTSSSNMVTQSSLENYLTPSSFRAYTASTSRYWRNGRTYKWIAVWAPTV